MSSDGDNVNPLKSDPELRIMLNSVKGIKKYRKFQEWKGSFLARLESFLSEKGMSPATRTCNSYEDVLQKYIKGATKVSGLIADNQLSHVQKNVKGTLGLNEMGNVLQTIIQDLKDLIPGVAAEEKKRGYTKFHLGAVLIRQGFHQYISMQTIQELNEHVEDKAGGQCDRLLLDWFVQYKRQVKRFCDVMADLGLYEVMMKCLEFQEEPDDESIDPDPITITIKTHDGKTITLELDPRETIGNVKEAIAPGCELDPDRQVLKYQGDELDDHEQTLEQYGIPDGAVLTVEPYKIPIQVKTPDGELLDMMMDPTEPLYQLKQDLEPRTGLTPENQKLKMNGLELNDDDENGEFYGIKPHQILELEPRKITVQVEMPDGSQVEIDVVPDDTGLDVKQQIEDVTGYPVPQQVLKHKGSEFVDPQTVRNQKIRHGDTLQVETFKVPVTVRTMDGKKIPVMVDPTQGIRAIKEDIEDEAGVPASRQNLFKDGDLLEHDDTPAGEYGIQPGTVLDMEPQSMTVMVELPDGQRIPVEITPRDTAEDIKDQIEQQSGLEAPRQVLQKLGKELPNGVSAKDMGLQDGDELQVDLYKVPVIVRTMDGKEIPVMVDPGDVLRAIKDEVAEESGIPTPKQNLFKEGQLLANDNTKAGDYGIQEGTILDLEPKDMTVTIEMPDGSHIEVDIVPSDTAQDIKQKIEDQTGLEVPRQVLQKLGKELPEGKTVKEMGVRDGDDLKVDLFKVPVIVRTMEGKEIPVMVDPGDALRAIKEEVADESGIPVPKQNLFMEGTLLGNDDKKAGEYGIQEGTVLDLEPKDMIVTVEMPDGSQIEVDIVPSDTSNDIKKKIEDKTGLEVPRQVLTKLGKELPEGQTVKDMGVRDGDDLKVDLFKVPVIVRTMDGQEIPVMVDPGDTLLAIKKEVEDDAGVPAEKQNLFKEGKLLGDDDKRAGDYGIQEGTVLDLEPKEMSVTVEMPDGSKIEVDLVPSDTADDIKQKIEDKTGLEAPRQVLKKLGKELPEGQTVKDMGVRDGDDLKVDLFKVPVIVRTMDGKEIPVMVDPGDKLMAIKEEVADESGIPAEKQNLFKEGELLGNDHKKAGEYGIEAGTVLDLEPKDMAVTIEMPDGSRIEVDIVPSDTAGDIKQKIEDKTGLEAPRQVLQKLGKELPEGKTVKDMGVRDGDDLKVDLFKVPVTVRTMDGKEIPVMVDPTQPLYDIKKDVERDADVPADNQNLFKDGSLLDDDNTPAGDYGIQEGTVLDLEPKTMTVNVGMPDGSQVPIDIKPSDTADDIKNKIEDKTGLEAPRQVLKKLGKELPDGKTAKDMGLKEGNDLRVDIFKVPVTVNNYDGKQIEIMVDPTETMSSIKERLEPESGLPAHNQQLSKAGKTLPDDTKTAGEYGIEAGTVLDLEPKNMVVNIELPDGRKIEVDVKPGDTSEDIKKKVETQSGIEVPRQVLKKGRKELPDNKRAVDMGIKDGDDLKVDIFRVPVEVHTMDGEELQIMVDPTRPLMDIKKEVEGRAGIPAVNQKLFMDGEELIDDNKIAKDHGIERGSILYMEPKKLGVTVDMPDGNTIQLDLSPWDTPETIKDKIHHKTGVHPRRQILSKRHGNELPNGRAAKDIPLQDGDALKVEIYTIPIVVEVKDSTTKIPLDVEPMDTTIDDIKNLISSDCGIPAKKQMLKFKKTELTEGRKTVDQCDIIADSVLVVEPKMDAIIFVDIKCNALFAVDREEAIEQGILTAPDNKLNFTEASTGPTAKDTLKEIMLKAPRLGVAPQVVVEGMEVEDYDIQEAEAVKNTWGVTLKKQAKNKKGEEFIFVDPKTGSFGELSRRKCLDKGFMTPIKVGKEWTLQEAEPDAISFDRYIADIRGIFGIKVTK